MKSKVLVETATMLPGLIIFEVCHPSISMIYQWIQQIQWIKDWWLSWLSIRVPCRRLKVQTQAGTTLRVLK